jgi:hypothetical protein
LDLSLSGIPYFGERKPEGKYQKIRGFPSKRFCLKTVPDEKERELGFEIFGG